VIRMPKWWQMERRVVHVSHIRQDLVQGGISTSWSNDRFLKVETVTYKRVRFSLLKSPAITIDRFRLRTRTSKTT
jgi:hypothetical protein